MSAGQIAAVVFLIVMVVLILRGVRGHGRSPVDRGGDDGFGPSGTGSDGGGGAD